MQTDQDQSIAFDAANPVEDRYAAPACGELDEIAEVLRDGRLSGGASIVAIYERALSNWFGSAHAVAVNSGSSALNAVLHVLGVGSGDEVMVPAVAPLPTALPILAAGAVPVIVDTLPGSLAFDPQDVRSCLTSRTKAAISVSLWGYPVDSQDTACILAEAGVPFIEDAAQAHGTLVRGRYAGTLTLAGCFSTHDRKLLSSGEGGFILTDDNDLYLRVEHYTRLGHLRGTLGVNYKLAAPLAAIGLRRLTELPTQIAARRSIANRVLTALPSDGRLAELVYSPNSAPNYYNLVLTSGEPNALLTEKFTDVGLPPDSVRYGYRPLHHQPLFRSWARDCPNAEALTASTYQIPVHPGLSDAVIQWIVCQTAEAAGKERMS